MEFSEVVKNRYSCKKFSARKLDGAKLEEILQAGRLAPTAKNLQEQHIYVVQSEEGLAKIDSVTPCRYGAPTCLVVTYDRGNVFTYPERSGIPARRMRASWQRTCCWLPPMRAWTAAGSTSLTRTGWRGN